VLIAITVASLMLKLYPANNVITIATTVMQAKIFMFLPFVFTFMLAQFPAGLVIYWAWNNFLSILQQWVIMKRMGTA